LVAVLSFGAIVGVSGCSDGTRAVTGSYTVPVVVTANGVTSTNLLTVIVK
jgi:hypothetical protein